MYTDQCDHNFTYALYPHKGDHVDGRVAQAGNELNVPLRTTQLAIQSGQLPPLASFLQVDVPNVFVEAVKQAEGDANQSVIIRLYEAEHRGVKASLTFGFPVISVAEVDMMEENAAALEVVNNCVQIEFKPFEIKTIKVSAGR